MSYTSVDPEVKSIKERCIRVAAIVITIKLGVSNNCDVEMNEKPRASPSQITMKRTPCNGSITWNGTELNGQL